MMDYLTKHQKLNVIGKIVMLALLGLFVLVVTLLYLNSAFGWFAQNEQVGGDGMAVTAYQDDVEVEYSHYYYDAKNATAVGVDSITDIQVPQYDLIFLQRNRYTPAIIRVAMTGEQNLPVSGTISLTITRNTTAASFTDSEGRVFANASELTALNNLFSSLMRFTIVKGAGIYSDDHTTLYRNIDNLPYGNNSTLYEVIKSQTTNDSTTTVFTTVRNGNANRYAKADSITLSIAYDENDWNDMDGDDEIDTLNIYVYVTYDKTLMQEYTGQELSLNGDINSVGKVLEMVNDMYNITAAHS